MVIALSILQFFGLAFTLAGQENEFHVKRYSASDGLIDNKINAIYQDHQGFMWFGTGSGLLKFNGYTFNVYRPDPFDSTSLGQMSVSKIFEDYDDNLWVITPSSFSKYNRTTDSFVNYPLEKFISFDQSYTILSVSPDPGGVLWILVNNKGIFRFDVENKLFQPLTPINDFFEVDRNKYLIKSKNLNEYHIQMSFSERYFKDTLDYKFIVNSEDGTHTWEAGTNRRIVLSGGDIELKPDEFRLPDFEIHRELQSNHLNNSDKKTDITFKVSVNNLIRKEYNIKSIELRGNILPLNWFDNRENPHCAVRGREDELWLGTTANGIYLYSLKTKNLRHFEYNEIKKYGMSNWIENIYKDGNDDIWISCSNVNKIFKYNRLNQTFTPYTFDSKHFGQVIHNGIAESSEHNIIVALRSREINYWKNGKFSLLEYPFTSLITALFIDRSGIIWIGTAMDGLYKFNPNIKKFPKYPKLEIDQDPFSESAIHAFYEDKNGTIWLGGANRSIFGFNRASGMYSSVEFEFNNPFGFIRQIYADSHNNIWLINNMVNKYDPKIDRVLQYSYDEYNHNSIGSNRPARILEDKNKNIWITSHDGILNSFSHETDTFTRYATFEQNQSWYQGADMWYLSEDTHGMLWITTGDQKGVLRFDPHTGLLKGFLSKPGNSNLGTHLIIDKRDQIWISGHSSGLYLFNQTTEQESLIVNSDSYINSSVRGIELDDRGNIWISTAGGLVKYHPSEGTFSKYFKEDGLQDNEFATFSHYKSQNGELFFGGKNGFNAFHPDSIDASKYPAPIVLTEFRTNNQLQKSGGSSTNKHISVADTVYLEYQQNDITLSFSAMDFSFPQRNQYTYILENYDDNWRPETNRNFAEYTNLDPGKYIFRVKGSNSDGYWNEKTADLLIIIHPPWWETWWAYSLYLMITFGLIYGVRRYELSRLKIKSQLKIEATKLREREEVDRLKSAFFTNISHEFRTPLTLIMGPLNRMIADNNLQHEHPSLNIMQRNAQRLLGLINQLLDFSKVESGKMQLTLNKSDIVPCVKGIFMSFQSLAEQKNIKYNFHTTHDSIQLYFDREKAEKIFMNILSNAFKFTPENGEVIVKIVDDDKNVLIKIHDTGQGIPEDKLEYIFDRFYQADDSMTRDQEGSGIGLALTKELVALHYGKISVISEPGKGCEFILEFRKGSTHFSKEDLCAHETEITKVKDFHQPVEDIDKEIINTSYRENIPGKSKVLVVEDNPDMRAYINDILRKSYNVTEAFNGSDGLKSARKDLPDIIISDLMMPKMNGYELCSAIKEDQATSHIPVILLTAKAERDDKLYGLQAGADDYLVKPFDTKELLIRVQNLILQRKRLQERFTSTIKVEPAEITVTSLDAGFLQQAIDIVEDNFTNEEFSVEFLSNHLNISSRRLHQKIKALTGLTPTEFILNLRLKRAADILRKKAMTVSEAAYSVGFNNLSYFARAFKSQFDCTPSQFS